MEPAFSRFRDRFSRANAPMPRHIRREIYRCFAAGLRLAVTHQKMFRECGPFFGGLITPAVPKKSIPWPGVRNSSLWLLDQIYLFIFNKTTQIVL